MPKKITKQDVIDTLRNPRARMYNWVELHRGRRVTTVVLTIGSSVTNVPKRLINSLEKEGVIETKGFGSMTYWFLTSRWQS